LRGVGYAASAALVVTIAPLASAAPVSGPVVMAASVAPKVSSRVDLVSAQVAARAQGSRVEVEGLREETSTTWVNPDGSLTSQQHQAPIRFKDPTATDPKTARWVSVNLGMEAKADGTAGAVAHPARLSISGRMRAALGAAKLGKGASAADAASVGTDAVGVNHKSGRSVSLAWPGSLPDPVLKDTTATYPDVLPGVDFVVHSRRTGFESDVVVKSAAARDALLVKAGSGPVSFSFPVKTKGLTARSEKDGSVSFVDAKGAAVSAFAAPTAWDARMDPRSGNRLNEVPVGMTVAQQNAGKAVLSLSVDRAWFAAADRQFPITIDPTYAIGTNITTSFDTFVSKSWAESTTPHSMTELRVGTYDGGGDVARSYLNFPVSSLQGKDVTSASLSLYAFHSYSCTAKPVYAYNSGAAGSSTTWGNQPVQYGTAASVSFAKGFSSSCAAGRVSIPVTSIVAGWSTTGYQNGSLKLSASETDSYGWKKFYSLESSQDPYITYTYNRKPNAAAAPTVTGGVTYTPPGGAVGTYTNDATPELSAVATDPDLNGYMSQIEVHSTTTGNDRLSFCSTPGFTASGQPVKCTIATPIANNTQVYARAGVKDDRGLWNGTWSPWTTIRVATTVPSAPSISCPAPYVDGYSTSSVPSSAVPCTVTATGTSWSAPSKVNVTHNGTLLGTYAITPSSNPAVAKATLTVPNTAGTHSLSAVASTPANVSGPSSSYALYYGSPTMESPADKTSTTGTVPVKARLPKPAGTLAGKVQWRVAGSSTDPWTSEASTLALDTVGTDVTASGSWNVSAVTGAGISERVPVTLEARVCLHTAAAPSTCLAVTAPSKITRLPNALGAGYPTDASNGAGTVALFTGEFSTSATDATMGPLGVSRSYESFSGDGTTADSIRGVFGPGWTGDFGAASGMSGWTVQDTTPVDGRISLTPPDGANPLVFAHPTGTRGTYARTSGQAVYVASNAAAEESELTLVLKDVPATEAPNLVVLEGKDAAGTLTRWTPTTTLNATTVMTWSPLTVDSPDPGTSAETYFYPITGDATKIGRIVFVPDGKSSTQCPGTGTWNMTTTSPSRGCTRLDITYGTTATAPQALGQVATVTATVWDPLAASEAGLMVTMPLAAYEYDSSKRLVKVTDSRTNLATRYAWKGTTTQLATITPPGLAPFRLWYAAGIGNQRLTAVTRDTATAGSWNSAALTTPPAGSTALARYVTSVPLSGAALADVTTPGVATWYQNEAPSLGYGVFGPDLAWDGTTTIMTTPSASSTTWQYGDVFYSTSDGYTVNTAAYGAGDWQLSSTDYDTEGRQVRTLDPAAISTIRTSTHSEGKAEIDAMSSQTVYNSDGQVTHEYGPAHDASMPFVTHQSMRSVTQYFYDGGAPNGGINPATGEKYGLLTTTIVGGVSSGGTVVGAAERTVTGYAPVEAGDPDSWATGLSTTMAQQSVFGPDPDIDITRTTRYDTKGRVIETRQPLATSTAHAGTLRTSYYSTATQPGADAPCGGRPEWDGLVCREYPGAAPSSGPPVPEKQYKYDIWGNTHKLVEQVGSTILRTTTTTHDTAGRVLTNEVTSTVAGSTPLPGQTFAYASATGLPSSITTTGTSASVHQAFDGWGRPTTYTNVQGDTSTTSYGADARPATVTENPATSGHTTHVTTYTWDGTDANGLIERRGLMTGLNVTRDGAGGPLTYQGAYDASGLLILQKMPGQLAQRQRFNAVGELEELTYTGQVTPVIEATDPVTNETIWTPGTPMPDQPWLTWSRNYTILGQVAQEWNGAGAAFDGVPGVSNPEDIESPSAGRALAAEKAFGYDHAGRLMWAKDRTAIATGTVIAPDSEDSDQSPCTWRTYGFDKNGNRTTFKEGDHTNCGWASLIADSSSATTNHTYSNDSADRAITGANGVGNYSYDPLGRQVAIPSSDTPQGGGLMTLEYFHNDLARVINQNGVTTTFTLDPALRRSAQTTSGTSTTTIVRRYTRPSDNPTWITTTEGGSTETMRISGSLTGIAAQIDTAGTTLLTLPDPRGDNVTNVQIPSTQTASAALITLAGWDGFDEFGNNNVAGTSTAPSGYGPFGAHQRYTSGATGGLTLMGMRLYNAKRGLFTSGDTVQGGGATSYAYPYDPINMSDTTGAAWYSNLFGFSKWTNTYNVWFSSTWFMAVRASMAGITLRLSKTMTKVIAANKWINYLVGEALAAMGAALAFFVGKKRPLLGWIMLILAPQLRYVSMRIGQAADRGRGLEVRLTILYRLTFTNYWYASWFGVWNKVNSITTPIDMYFAWFNTRFI